MKKQDVIKHFGSQTETAKVCGIGKSAVNQWNDIIPMGRALQIERQTNGALKFDESLYQESATDAARV
ncbi:MAG: Cro/CI family transcriptional regulator [Pseudomonadota bacterium]|nr:Cro/CI family transcriptional regulator [Pseudomonadota bacterium]